MGYMPLMVELKRVVVFGGERGEGLQKTQKLCFFADEVLVIPENQLAQTELFFPAGQLGEVKEKLVLEQPRTVQVHPQAAANLSTDELAKLIKGASFVVSDLSERAINEKISTLAASLGVLCTIVDTKDLSRAWFMSLVKTRRLTAAFSSDGKIAFFASKLRQSFQKNLEARDGEAELWEKLRAVLPKGQTFQGLEFLWKNWAFRLRIRLFGPQRALKYGFKKLKQGGFVR